MKYILYGAGYFAKGAVNVLGKDNIREFLVSTMSEETPKEIDGIPVTEYNANLCREAKGDSILIAVKPHSKAEYEISAQLDADKIKYGYFEDIRREETKKKILSRPDNIKVYEKAIEWIKNNSVKNEGIINSSNLKKSYPEVTGYFIPTLLDWGYRDLAITYGKWLCDIQKENGSWHDTEGSDPYIFDSGQVLKGLLAIRDSIVQTELDFPLSVEKLDQKIRKGCDWILSCMNEAGRLVTPSENEWPDEHTISEAIHIYCLEPIYKAAAIYQEKSYKEKADKILNYYLSNYSEVINDFSLISHFWSYIMEGLVDVGRSDIARKSMQITKELQDEIGFVPAYKNEHWCCSTGLFQQAVVWYKLGDVESGNKAFDYGCRLQNESGGWYGGYPNPDYTNEVPTYFPDYEISWAVKYFLDALHYKNLTDFNGMASSFKPHYSKDDGRYIRVRHATENAVSSAVEGGYKARVLDVGCGKGAYLVNLIEDQPDAYYFGVDISGKVLSYIDNHEIETKTGSLTSIPYKDNYFDLTYTCEALEHAIDIDSAVREMCRVTKAGGRIIIIDKNVDKIGELEIGEWEQWFDDDSLVEIMSKYCKDIKIDKNVSYEEDAEGLFHMWTGIVKQ